VARRKGELTAAGIDRGWPHQVAVPADICRGSHGRFMEAFCLDLSVCRVTVSSMNSSGEPSTASRTQSTPRNSVCDSGASNSIQTSAGVDRTGRAGTRVDVERLYCGHVRTIHSQLYLGADPRALSLDCAGSDSKPAAALQCLPNRSSRHDRRT
jgi:hypothetical protein